MPLRNVQAVLKKVLPEKAFDSLYNVACNVYDVYQKIYDRTAYIPSYIVYLLKVDEEKVNRVETVQKVLGHTMVSKIGVEMTYDMVYRASNDISGCFVECGVARGGCSAVMAMIANREGKGRRTWLFDSFEGLPPQTDADGVQKPIRHKNRKANDLAQGYCLGTIEDVRGWFLKLKLTNVTFVKGWFNETLPKYKEKVGAIAVLRLDGDWYESTKCCLGNFYGNVVVGGYVIIDDYQLPGCKKAVDEFLFKLNPIPEITLDKNGRSYIRK